MDRQIDIIKNILNGYLDIINEEVKYITSEPKIIIDNEAKIINLLVLLKTTANIAIDKSY